MDTQDIRLLRELVQGQLNSPFQSDIRKSLRTTARNLGMHENTARGRIRKLQQMGFLRGWRVIVNPTLMGQSLVTIALTLSPPYSKDDIIRKLRLIDGVVVIINCFGDSLAVGVSYENQQVLRRKVELISRITNAESLTKIEIPFPKCGIEPSETDWKIVRALRLNPRRSLNSMSKELGLSTRTVQRRLRRMVGQYFVFVIPSLDPKALKGAIAADLVVSYSSLESKAEADRNIMSHLDEYVMRAEVNDREHGLFNLILTNVSQAREIQRWVEEQPGIKSAWLGLIEDRIELYDTFSEQLETKMAEISNASAERTKAKERNSESGLRNQGQSCMSTT